MLGKNEKLENLFGLPPLEKNTDEPITTENSKVIQFKELSTLEKIDQALDEVTDLDKTDREMDEIAEKAMQSFQDLMELGMQVDGRTAPEIFSVASSLLNHAITAKNNKINRKLKSIELQLKKARLEKESMSDTDGDIPVGTGSAIDRNELLNMIKNQKNDK